MSSRLSKRQVRGQTNRKIRARDVGLGIDVKVPGIGSGKLNFQHKKNGRKGGQYEQVPVAFGRLERTRGANLNGKRAFVVNNSEFIANVQGSGDFATSVVRGIQPGIPGPFPWLSGIASNYEQYRIKRFAARYEPVAPTTSAGTVMLAIDYDPLDPLPGDKTQMMTMAGAVRSTVWMKSKCFAEQFRRRFEKLFVRTGALPANADLKTYDYGYVVVAVEGTPTGVVGELYFDYEIEFFTPEGSSNLDILSASYDASFTGGTRTTPFAGGPVGAVGELSIHFPTSSTFMLNRVGTYIFTYLMNGVGCTQDHNPTYSALATNSDASDTFTLPNNASGLIVSTIQSSWSDLVSIGSEGDGFTVDMTAMCTTFTNFVLQVTPYNVKQPNVTSLMGVTKRKTLRVDEVRSEQKKLMEQKEREELEYWVRMQEREEE